MAIFRNIIVCLNKRAFTEEPPIIDTSKIGNSKPDLKYEITEDMIKAIWEEEEVLDGKNNSL